MKIKITFAKCGRKYIRSLIKGDFIFGSEQDVEIIFEFWLDSLIPLHLLYLL